MMWIFVQPESNPIFFDAVTGHKRFGFELNKSRNFSKTAFIRISAAAVENTARGKVDGGWDLAFEFQMFGFLNTELRNGA